MRVAGDIIDFTKIKSSYAMPDLLQLQKIGFWDQDSLRSLREYFPSIPPNCGSSM